MRGVLSMKRWLAVAGVLLVPAAVTAEGVIVPARQARLAFAQPGRIARVAVEPGQQVQAGQVLAALEDAEAALAVRAAEDGLRVARAEAARFEQPARAEDLAALAAAVGAAEAKLAQLQAAGGPDEQAARA